MTLNPALKRVMVVSAKNAVNALLTNATLTAMFPHLMNLHNPKLFWWTVGKVAISSVIAREAVVWGPKVLQWSESGISGGS